jgi:thioester reductase-like protein
MNERMSFRARGRDVLVTGFPAFLPRLMLESILEREPESRVRLLVSPDDEERARDLLADLAVDPKRIDLLIGDVAAIDLGLSGTEYLDLVAEVTDIYHMASHWYVGAERERLYDVNVRGTRNVIDTASEMRSLERFNHLSTAFVAGDRTGVIMEDELDEGQDFRNPYEETKFEAEVALREKAKHLPVTIYRPTIVVGDSKTGEIDRMAGPYYLIHAIVQTPNGVPIPMPGRGDFPLDMVPADYVCNAIYALSRQEETVDETFHLCDPNPLSARTVFELIAEHADREPPVGHMPYQLARWIMKFPLLERVMRSPRQFLEDFNQLTLYNGMHTAEALGGRLQCPSFPSYVEHLVDFVRRSEVRFDADAGFVSSTAASRT